jgi:glycosyltransferase involved in cell wall biosynthesis
MDPCPGWLRCYGSGGDRQVSVHVALVNDSLGRGGAEQVLLTMARHLRGSRFVPHVITTRSAGELAQELPPDVPLFSLNRRALWDTHALKSFARIVARERIRIVHTHSHTASYFVRLAQLRYRLKWLHVVHDHYPLIEEDRVLRWLDRLLLSGVDYYFTASKDLLAYADRWLGIPSDRRERLLNGIDVSGCRPCDTPPAPFTVAQVGRLAPQKDQLMALRVVDALRLRIPRFRWLIAGRADGTYAAGCRAEVERLGLREHVSLLGEQPHVSDLLNTADVGVLTSRDEGLPIALLEYMAHGLPVIVTDVGDCGDVVRASRGGYVVASGDVESFVQAIVALAADPGAARNTGAANLEYVRKHYSSVSMVDRTKEVYETLLSLEDMAHPAAAGRGR